MADEDDTAKTAIIFDASGAEDGAARTVAAGEKVIAVEAAMADQGTETANAAVVASSKIAAAAEDSSARTSTGYTSQINLLNRLARAYDPLASAADTASKNLGALLDIVDRGGPNAARALSMISDATDVLLTKTADLDSGTKNIQDSMDRLTAKFAPAVASAKQMAAEIAELNGYVKNGGEIQGTYQGALDNIIASYDEGAQAAKRFVEAQQQLYSTPQDVVTQKAQSSQSLTTEFQPSVMAEAEYQATLARVNQAIQEVNLSEDAAEGFREKALDTLTALIAKYDGTAAAAQAAAEASAEHAKTIEALTVEFQPLVIAEAEYQATLARIDQAIQEVNLSEDAAEGYRQKALVTLDTLTAKLNGTAEAEQAAADAASQQAQRIETLTAKYQPLVIAEAEYQAALADINQAIQLTGLSEESANAERDKALASLDALTAKLDGTAAAEQEAAASATLNAKQLEAWTEQFQPLLYAEAQHQAAMTSLAAATKSLGLSETEIATATRQADDALAKATGTLNTHTASTGQADFATRQLGVQTIQFFTSVETGQPLLTSFIQQFHQVIDVQVATGTSIAQLGTQIGKVFASIGAWVIDNPLIVGITAIVSAVVALGVAAESTARQSETLQDQLSATRTNYAALATEVKAAAQAVAATTNISTADARTAGQTLAAAPNFNGTQQQLQALIVTANQLATVFGVTAAQGAEELAKALQDPGAEAEALATKHFPGMTQALADNIKRMSNSGDVADAFNKVLAVLQTTTGHVTDAQTPLQTALSKLSDAFTKTGQDGRSFANILGTAITDAAAAAINAITNVITSLRNMQQQASAPTPTPGGAPSNNAALTPDLSGRPVLTTDNQHFGLMQVSTGVASSFGLNPMVQDQNILAGLSYIKQLNDQLAPIFGAGNQTAISGSYNKGPTGYQNNPASAAGYISAVQGANISKLPADVASQIAYWGQILGLPPDLINLGQRIAVVESGGQQFGGLTSSASVAAAGTTPPIDRIDATATANGAVGSGVSVDLQTQVNNAKVISDQVNQLDLDIAKNLADQATLQQGIAAAQQLPGDHSAEIAAATKALAELQGQALSLVDAQTKLKQAAEDQLGPLQAQAGFARDMATIENNAMLAARAHGQAIDQVTLALTKQSEQIKLASQFNDLVTATNQQTDAQLRINAAFDGTQDSLTHAQNAEKAYAQSILDFKPGSDEQIAAAARYTAALDAGSAATEQLQQKQQALQDLSGAFTQAFDQIGQGITNSFLQGTGAAVNWGNVMTTVAQQVLQEFLKLAVLNPLLNSLFGQKNTTLTGALGALTGGGTGPDALTGALGTAALAATANGQVSGDIPFDLPGSTSASTGTSASTLLSDGGTLLSVGKALFPDLGSSGSGGGGFLSGLTDSIGLTGPNGLVDALSGTNSALSGLTGLLNTSIIAPTAGVGEVSLGGFGSAAVPTLTGGLTIGSALGAGSVGFGAGSLAGGLVQGAVDKTGPGPEVGAALGTAAGIAGVALAPETFGASLLLAGLLGGTAGGALGGLIGPKPASPFSSTTVSSGLQEGATVSQLTDTSSEVATLNAQLAQISAFLAQSGLSETQPRTIQVGQNSPNGPVDNSKFSDLFTPNTSGHSAFNEESFTSQDPNVNEVISTRSFPDLQTLQTVFTATSAFVQNVASVQGFDIGKFLSTFQGVDSASLPAKFQAVSDFLTQVVPALGGLNLTTNTDLNGVANMVSQFNSLSDAFASLRFASNNSDVNEVVYGRSFSDQQDLTTVVTALNQFVTDVAGSSFNVAQYLAGLGGVANSDLPTVLAATDQFVTQTVPTLLKFNDVTGSLNDQITQITAQFATAIQTAGQLDYQEQALTATRDAAIAAAENAARHSADLQAATTNAQTLTTQASLNSGTIGGSVTASVGAVPGAVNDNVPAAEAAALATFDVQRQTQIEQLQTQYQGIFGDAYATTQDYIENSVALEASLGAQRLAIQKQYNDAIAQAEQQLGDQLRSYQGQYLTSQAQISGNPADTETANLYNFDAQAQSQREQLVSQFQALYGDAYAQTSQYVQSSTALEASLGEQRLAIQKQYNDQLVQQQEQVANTQSTLQGQYLTAAAQISGSPTDAENAQLYNFDAQATQQRQQLVAQFEAIYGSAYASQSQYVQTSALLEKSLGEQRLAIQTQANTQILQQQEQAAQSVTSVVTSLKTYALSLQQGSASPLSLKDQYNAASAEFNSVSGAALGGDFNSLQELQTYAQALQQASQAVNGSGAGYATDIARIENVLNQVAMTPTETLTSEAFTAGLQTQTATLSGDLGDLKDLLSQMLTVLSQASRAPTTFSAAA